MKATIVFQKNWNAINERLDDGSNRFRYIINRGSSRSSKTISLIQLFDLYARSNESKRCTVWRDTKTDCKKTVLVDMLKTLKRENLYKVGQDFNKTESIFTYNNDSTVEIHGTDDEETVHGLTQDLAWLNEPYKISRETFDQIDQRTSDFIFIDYNPKKGHWVEDLIKDKRTIIVESTFKDNPFCPIEQKNKILSYQPISRCEAVESKILSKDEALSYDPIKNKKNLTKKQLNELIRCVDNESKNSANEFNWSVYGLGEKAEKPNRIFKWKEISLIDYNSIQGVKLYGIDWGTVDPWGIIEAKYTDGKLYLRELNYKSENEWREKLTSTELHQINANETSKEIGLVQLIINRLGIEKRLPTICDTNRPLKIASLNRAGYNAFPAPSKSILDGISILEDLDIYYTSDSPNIAYEQENYTRKVDRYGIVLDEPEDKDNHTIDPARYIALYLKIKGFIKTI